MKKSGPTVIYDESEVYYDVGVSLKGSMAARPVSSLVGFRVKFNPDQNFAVCTKKSSSTAPAGAPVPNGQDEMLVKHLMQAAGDIPGMYDDLAYVVSPRGTETRRPVDDGGLYRRLFRFSSTKTAPTEPCSTST